MAEGADPPVALGRLRSIDALRGLGALMVLAQHGLLGEPVFWGAVLALLGPGWVLAYPLLQGATGVNLFLVVSGFCIHYRSARRNPDVNPDFLPFWVRRLWRLYPPFMAAAGLGLLIRMVALTLWHPEIQHWTFELFCQGLSGGTWPFVRDMVVHVFMLFPLYPGSVEATDGDPFWSLALEEQLYLLYFLLPWLRRRYGMPRTVLVTLTVTLVWRALGIFCLAQTARVPTIALHYAAPVLTAALRWLDLWTARWFEWMLGAWAVEMALGRSAKPGWTRHGGVAVGAMVLAMLSQGSRIGWVATDALWGTGFFVCLNKLVELEQRGLPLRAWVAGMARVGLFSYSLYLTHYPVVHLLKYLLEPHLAWYMAYPLSALVAIPLAYGFYRLFEVPAIARSHRPGRPAAGVEPL